MKFHTSLILFAIADKHINDFISHEHNKKNQRSVPSFEDLKKVQSLSNQQPWHSRLEISETSLKVQDDLTCSRVNARSAGSDGRIIWAWNDSLMFSTLTCNVDFSCDEANEHGTIIEPESMNARFHFNSCATMIIKYELHCKKKSAACGAGNDHVYYEN